MHPKEPPAYFPRTSDDFADVCDEKVKPEYEHTPDVGSVH